MVQSVSYGAKNPDIEIFKSRLLGDPTATRSGTYAIKGEPCYDDRIDLDNDGKITFKEFQKYCEDNNISKAQQQEMMNRWCDWQLFKSRSQYAKEGDTRYKKEMDENSDGIVDYDEYLKYQQNKEELKEDSKTDKKLTKLEKAYFPQDEEENSTISVEA